MWSLHQDQSGNLDTRLLPAIIRLVNDFLNLPAHIVYRVEVWHSYEHLFGFALVSPAFSAHAYKSPNMREPLMSVILGCLQ